MGTLFWALLLSFEGFVGEGVQGAGFKVIRTFECSLLNVNYQCVSV